MSKRLWTSPPSRTAVARSFADFMTQLNSTYVPWKHLATNLTVHSSHHFYNWSWTPQHSLNGRDTTKTQRMSQDTSSLNLSTWELKHLNACSQNEIQSQIGETLLEKNFQPRSATFTAGVTNTCVVCKGEKHPLFACPQFKSMPRSKMISIVLSKHQVLMDGHLRLNTEFRADLQR